MAVPLTLLAFDYGTRRTGVAVGNTLLRRAQPLATLVAEGDAVFAKAEPLIRDWQPAALVVGIPLHPDGAAHENTHRAERFARRHVSQGAADHAGADEGDLRASH